MSAAAPDPQSERGALAAFDRAVGKAVWFGAIAAGVCINALVLMILAQVFARNLLDMAFAFVLDIGGWLFVAISFLAFGWALRAQAHIRMTALTEKLRPPIRRWFDLAADVMALGFCAFFLVSIWRNLAQAWRTGVTAPGALDVPIYPVWAAAMLGVGLLALQFLVEFLRDARAIATGKDRTAASSSDRQAGDI